MDVIDELHAAATRMIGGADNRQPPEAYVAGVHEAINAAVRLLADPDGPHPVVLNLTDDTVAADTIPNFLRRVVVHLGRTARSLGDGRTADAANVERIMQACELLLLAAGSLEWQRTSSRRNSDDASTHAPPLVLPHDAPVPATTDKRQANWLAALILGIANEGAVSDRDVMEVVRLSGWNQSLVELAASKLARVDLLREDTRQRIAELRDRAMRVTTDGQPNRTPSGG